MPRTGPPTPPVRCQLCQLVACVSSISGFCIERFSWRSGAVPRAVISRAPGFDLHRDGDAEREDRHDEGRAGVRNLDPTDALVAIGDLDAFLRAVLDAFDGAPL